jgi:hypothetical protein
MAQLIGGPASAVAEHVLPFLLEHEPENNVMIGFLMDGKSLDTAYLRAIDLDGQITAAAFYNGHRLLLSQASRLDGLEMLVADVRENLPELHGFGGPEHVCERFRGLWTAYGETVRPWMRQRLFVLRQVTPPSWPPGQLRLAQDGDLELLTAWIRGFIEDTGIRDDVNQAITALPEAVAAERIFIWECDGQPVSTARVTGRTPHGARISAVYTPPDLRGRGYASAAVAALSQRVLDSGMDYCCLYTDLANPTSNHIYQAIGYMPLFDVPQYLFD